MYFNCPFKSLLLCQTRNLITSTHPHKSLARWLPPILQTRKFFIWDSEIQRGSVVCLKSVHAMSRAPGWAHIAPTSVVFLLCHSECKSQIHSLEAARFLLKQQNDKNYALKDMPNTMGSPQNEWKQKCVPDCSYTFGLQMAKQSTNHFRQGWMSIVSLPQLAQMPRKVARNQPGLGLPITDINGNCNILS